ncbi:MAG: hypothetical protein NVS3B16_25350 [Vulcanimicrobiaceae bacterium]
MGDLHQNVRIACPYASAAMHVSEYLERNGPNSVSAQFNMRLEQAALVALDLQPGDRGVRVAIRALPIDDGQPRYRIRWMPEREGPHTLFLGELALERLDTERDDAFALRIDGRYELPRTRVPSDSDASVARIAAATAAAVLTHIDTFVTRAANDARTRVRHTNGVSHGHYG